MKWMKHLTAASDDEKIAKLVDKGGLAAYGLYWRVNEIIAAHMEGQEPSCSVSYSIAKWSRLLGVRGANVERQLRDLGATGVATIERRGDDITATNRNLLKYRDEYSKKSGHTPDNVPPRTDTEVEEEVDTEVESTFAPSDPPVAPLPILGTFPCTGKSKFWPFTQKQLDEWAEAYPGIDLMAQLRQAKQWLISHPKRGKTNDGMAAYINNWLKKAQNECGGLANGKGNHANISRTDQIKKDLAEALTRMGSKEAGQDPAALHDGEVRQ